MSYLLIYAIIYFQPPSIESLIPLDETVTVEDIVNMGDSNKQEERQTSNPETLQPSPTQSYPTEPSNVTRQDKRENIKLQPAGSKSSSRPLTPLVIPACNQINLDDLNDNVAINLPGSAPKSPSRFVLVTAAFL